MRPIRILTVSALAALLLIVAAPVSASPDSPAGDEAAFIAEVNRVRAENGVSGLAPHSRLVAGSQAWSAHMAAEGTLSHASSSALRADAPMGWTALAENVGQGPSVAVLMHAFVTSPAHLRNILEPAYGLIGVGVVWIDGQMFVTLRFAAVPDETPAPSVTSPAEGPVEPPEAEPPTPTEPPVRSRGVEGVAAPPQAQTSVPTTAPAPVLIPPGVHPDRVALVLESLSAAG